MLFVPLGIVALAATSYARKYPDWAEHVYAQGVYPALSSVVGFLPSLVSFSVAEWVAALFLLLSLIHIFHGFHAFPDKVRAAINEAGIKLHQAGSSLD